MMQKPEYPSCRLRRERKIGSSSPSCVQPRPGLRIELGPLAGDVPL